MRTVCWHSHVCDPTETLWGSYDGLYFIQEDTEVHRSWVNFQSLCILSELTRLLCPWDSLGKNTRVGCHALLQEIFPIQGLNPGFLHCRPVVYWLSHQESPRTLEWVACPFSRGSSQPRNRTGVSYIAGRFFTNWATREAHQICILPVLLLI